LSTVLNNFFKKFFIFGSIINVVVSEKGITTFLNLWQKNKRFESPMNYNNSSKNKTTKGLNLKSLI
jgi:hypothetical protein